MKLPEGHQQIMPYLIIDGVDAFIQFAKQVLGAKETFRRMRDEQVVMHAEVQIGVSTVMMADSTNDWPTHPASLFIYVENADATYQKALEAGAVSVMEMSTEDYGRTGGFRDPQGNVWWITTVLEN